MADLSTQPYKGARDFYPEDERLQKWIFDVWRKVCEKYGYEEYNAPILELTEIYKAKSGQEIVDEQTYSFKDRGGREVCIRPEMTPTVSRMVAAKRQELGYPLRWYSLPNLWRYERPQHGRMREHWQLNVDIFGVNTIDADLELIMVANDIMEEFGASKEMFTVKINSRKLVNIIMADYLSLDVNQTNLMSKLLDKKDKLPEDTFRVEAEKIFGDHKEEVSKLLDLLNAKSLGDLPDELTDTDPIREIQILFTLLKENGITNAVFDVSLMRGFDYYTDIVFEVFDNHPDNSRALFGGGRYDGLVGMFGVEPVATAGFGMGDVRLIDFLKVHELTPDLRTETDVYLVVVGDVLRQAQGVANILRQEGINTAVDITGRKVEKQIKNASKKGIKYVLFVGEQELDSEQFTLRDIESGDEEKRSLERIISLLHDTRS